MTTETVYPSITPGSRWVNKHGIHAGLEVVVVRQTAKSVVVKTVKGTGGLKGEARQWNIAMEMFPTRYAPYTGANGTAGGAHRYRRSALPKLKPIEELAVFVAPAAGVLTTGGTELAIEVLTITPSMAAGWLEHSAPNRSLRQPWVESIANDIRGGRWHLTGDTIKIDADGQIRDGQHRLHAIVRAGVAVQAVVVRGVAADAFKVMDTGRGRKVGDVLKLAGHKSEALLAGMVKALLLLERFGFPAPLTKEAEAHATAAATLAYIEKHPDVFHAVQKTERIRKTLQGSPSLWAAALVMFYRIDPVQADEFAEMLGTGANLTAGHPVLALRGRMTGHDYAWTRDARARLEMMALVIKAWNLWRRGSSVGSLRWRESEGFPVPV